VVGRLLLDGGVVVVVVVGGGENQTDVAEAVDSCQPAAFPGGGGSGTLVERTLG